METRGDALVGRTTGNVMGSVAPAGSTAANVDALSVVCWCRWLGWRKSSDTAMNENAANSVARG